MHVCMFATHGHTPARINLKLHTVTHKLVMAGLFSHTPAKFGNKKRPTTFEASRTWWPREVTVKPRYIHNVTQHASRQLAPYCGVVA